MTNILKTTTTTAVAFVMILTLDVAASQAGARIKVRLASGRAFDAEVATRTNSSRLWLSFRTRSAELLRPVSWESIEVAQLNGESLTSEQLRQRLLASRVALASQISEETDDTIGSHETPEDDSEPTMADEALEILFTPSHQVHPPRVASVRFDAYIANWDADVETDGLIVHALPVDAAGHVVPTQGHLEVELHTTRRIAFNDGAHKRGRRVARIGRWTKQLPPHMPHSGGAWFKLPFQADHPEFDTQLGAAGLVHVKLVVPGDGVFEASLDGVRVRPYAPLRDDMQQVEGRRFLAHERTGRGQRTN